MQTTERRTEQVLVRKFLMVPSTPYFQYDQLSTCPFRLLKKAFAQTIFLEVHQDHILIEELSDRKEQ